MYDPDKDFTHTFVFLTLTLELKAQYFLIDTSIYV